MNIELMPNDVNLEFYQLPPEIVKLDEDIKSCYFNECGSIIAIVTKSNMLKFFDFIGRTIIFTINYFKEYNLNSKEYIKFTSI